MIEQTELVVTEWHYHEPVKSSGKEEKIFNTISLDVMKKRAGIKKGISCRFSCLFKTETQSILLYVAEDSYVIDLGDKIDKNELLTMLRNSYAKCKESFDLRKMGTVLQNKSLTALDENKIDFYAILPLLD